MNTLDLTRDVVPVSEFRKDAASLLKRAKEGSKIVLTHNGRAAGVVLGVEQYQEMELRLRELESVVDALRAKAKDQLIDNEVVMREAAELVKRAR